MSVIMTVIDIVADIIVNAEECPVHVVRREHLNPEPEAMRAVAVEEMSRSVIVYEIPFTRRYPVNIMVVNPEVIRHASPDGRLPRRLGGGRSRAHIACHRGKSSSPGDIAASCTPGDSPLLSLL